MGTLLFLVVVVLVAIAVLRTNDTQKTLPRTSYGRTTTSYLDPPDTWVAGLQSRGCWVPPGTTVTVQGITIPGGMVYVGSKMVSLGYGSGPDPALVNPKLSIHGAVDDVGYWPSYSQIPPGNRGDYLRWLAGGRRDPDADLCYPFLFFYGLERRLLFDLYATTNPVGPEVEVLVCEIEEMLTVYGDNRSFNGYARGLISHAHAWAYRETPDRLLNTPVSELFHELPSALRAGIATMARASLPLPARWAHRCVVMDGNTKLRTPGKRCAGEFESLFCSMFQEKHGDGIALKPDMGRVLELTYRPASAGFHGSEWGTIRIPELHDPTQNKAFWRPLRAIAGKAVTALEPYSRALGRDKDPDSWIVKGLLPPQLLCDAMAMEGCELQRLLALAVVEAETSVVKTTDLLEMFPGDQAGKWSKAEATALTLILEAFGFGMEPDVRLGHANPSRTPTIAVFELPPKPKKMGVNFTFATVLLRLGVAVAAADSGIGPEERESLRRQVEKTLKLKHHERQRLRAYLLWLITSTPGTAGLRLSLRALSEVHRHLIGESMIMVAGADGFVSPDEIKALRRGYSLLGLDPETLFADVHDLATAAPSTLGGSPAKIIEVDLPPGRSIQPPEVETGFSLDPERVAAIALESEEVSAVLANILAAEEAVVVPEPEEEVVEDSILPGLDAQHAVFVAMLMGRPSWRRDDLTLVAVEHGLMADGAIEVVNEAAFEAYGDALLEGSDPVEINTDILSEIAAA